MTIIAKQFGFANNLGNIANLVDGDFSTYWSPLPTNFSGYPDQFFIGDPSLRSLNYGKPFPALEFDLGEAKRVTQIYLSLETALALGPAVLIGSHSPATSPANTLQNLDAFLAEYTQAEIVSNRFLPVTTMKQFDIRRRYLRLLQRSSQPSVVQPTPGPTNSFTFDSGAGSWQVVDYSVELTIEVWGGGASGGLSADAQNGGQSQAGKDSWGSLPTANGGVKATASSANSATGAGTGGTAANGNTLNTTGGDGGVPTPASSLIGFGGKGGDAPNGGLGGAAVYLPLVLAWAQNFAYGNPGQGPGGGGSGRVYWYPSGDVIYQKFPGGGSGGYCKHVVARGSGLADPGSFIGYLVGAGGASNKGDGQGANGRVRFSWT